METPLTPSIELKPGERIELVLDSKIKIVFLAHDMEVEVEAIGGGGGGGGSTRLGGGGSGGSGGRAGEVQFAATTLERGFYTVEVGEGGGGGAGKGSYDDGPIDYALPGTLSRIYRNLGGEILVARGGARGEHNHTERLDGDPGQNTVNRFGTEYVKGGKGGDRDRDGADGPAPGAGGGGCGVFVKGGALRGGRGGDGRVIFQAFPGNRSDPDGPPAID